MTRWAVWASARRVARLSAMVGLWMVGSLVLAGAAWLSARRREALIALWSRAVLWVCGTRVRERAHIGGVALSACCGTQGAGAGRLLLANHVSWLDILAINSLAPASFVAKAEIAAWPLAGSLVARAGTVFLERGRRHAVHAVVQALAAKLQQGVRVAVFPEGTTTDGRQVLPFHGNLLQAAFLSGASVIPVALRYVGADDQPCCAAALVGDMSFWASLWRVTGQRHRVVEVHVLPGLQPDAYATRHALADAARSAIAQCLDLPQTHPAGSGAATA